MISFSNYDKEDGAPITGILEDYYFYKPGDIRNLQYVVDGYRVAKPHWIAGIE